MESLRLNLQQENANDWTGNVQTTLYTGNVNDSNGATFTYAACIQAFDSQGPFSGDFQGFVSGTLS